MRHAFIVTAALLVLSSSAFAAPASTGSDIPEPNVTAAPKKAEPVQPAKPADTNGSALQTVEPTEQAAAPDCKLVKIHRPDVGTHHDIVVRFKNLAGANAVDKIQACNQNVPGSSFISVAPSSVGGFRVKFSAPGGWGVINLPIGMTDGTADQLVCNVGGADTMVKYATQWSGSLPEKIELTKLDSFDEEAGKAACRAAKQALTANERRSIGLQQQ